MNPRKTFTDSSVSAMVNAVHHFKDEKSMANYIDSNIRVFCEEILGDGYMGHRREHNLFGSNTGRNGGRVDFLIHGSCNEYLVEIKNPTNVFSELTKSIGHMLVYGELLIESGINAEMVLVTSKHERMLPLLIGKYALPIRYIVFNKEISFEAEICG